jgi:FixJ family two-component response regulator
MEADPALFTRSETGAGQRNRVSSVIGIVDDDVLVLRALRRLLEGVGFAVKTFGSAEELLALENPEAINCLVVDIHMPGLSGFDLQERLADDAKPLIPIIFITANDDAPTRERARRGGVAYFPKPFEAQSLLEAIAKALGGQ